MSEIVQGGVVPGAIEMMDARAIEASEQMGNAGWSTRAAALLVELDGSQHECEARFDEVVAICERNGSDDVRVARDEAERQLFWKMRKAAFPAMGRISPNYFVQDGVIPRTKLPEVLERIDALAKEYDMIVANVFHAGDGNLHPLVCYDGRKRGRRGEGRGALRPDHRRVPGRRRVDHRRARRRHRQEEAHAEDVRRGRPGRVPAAALLVRPRRAGQPGQADADAAAVRRGAGPLPGASAGGRRAGGAVLRPDDRRRGGHAAAQGLASAPVRPVGGGTKPWLPARDEEPLETGGLDRILEHNVGDFTAVLEAGVPFAEAQATFAEHGQRLAWDPPDPGGATIGGIVATADSGPLRHRYGGVRDLVVGTTVVLSDGTIAKSGGKVIKNVAGYDLAKLFAGSFGTLGLIATVSVRLHPLPEQTATVRGSSSTIPDALLAKALELARQPLEADCFDVVWEDGARPAAGPVLGRRRRGARRERVGRARRRRLGRRARRCSAAPVVLKVSGRPTDLPDVIRAAAATARPSSRAPRSGSRGSRCRTPSASRRSARRSRRAAARCSTARPRSSSGRRVPARS